MALHDGGAGDTALYYEVALPNQAPRYVEVVATFEATGTRLLPAR